MGTPAFAVPSLAILHHDFHVAAVVTAPDKPAGRGMKLQQSEVKKFALAQGIPVLQPGNLKSPEFLDQLKKINADLQVVVAFRMLPEPVWSLPPLGTINLHGSLLPQYRGAAPIHWAVIHGEKETGVTTFKLKHDIDTGNILFQEKIPIGDEETTGSVHDRMMQIGADLLLKTVHQIQSGEWKEIPQEKIASDVILKHAPKIQKEDCRIDWSKPTAEIYNFVRGLYPFPVAFTFIQNARIKVISASKEIIPHTLSPGDFVTDGKSYLKFATADGFLNIRRLKPEGKREMSVEEYLRGNVVK